MVCEDGGCPDCVKQRSTVITALTTKISANAGQERALTMYSLIQ